MSRLPTPRRDRPTAPPALRPGDLVAVVSPSAGRLGEYPQRAARGCRALQRLGFRTRVLPAATSTGRWVSAPAEDRVADLHAAFADEEVRAIVCGIGGRGAAELLPLLDFDLVARNPTVFCGYSDSTALHVGIGLTTGMITFYGPSLMMEFAEFPEPLPETVDGFLRAVAHSEPLGAVPQADTIITESSDWSQSIGRRRMLAPQPRVLRAGTGAGPLAGGCLPVLAELLGTPWQPRFAGRLLMLETPQDYPPGLARSHLIQLRSAGLLADISGLVVGWPGSIDDLDDLAAVIDDVIPAEHPVVLGAPFGHTSPIRTLPLGADAELEVAQDGYRLVVTGAAVTDRGSAFESDRAATDLIQPRSCA